MKRSTLAAILIAFPIPGLALTVGLYAILALIFNATHFPIGIAMVINIILSALGLICIAGILIGIPIGLYLLLTDRQPETEPLPSR